MTSRLLRKLHIVINIHQRQSQDDLHTNQFAVRQFANRVIHLDIRSKYDRKMELDNHFLCAFKKV